MTRPLIRGRQDAEGWGWHTIQNRAIKMTRLYLSSTGGLLEKVPVAWRGLVALGAMAAIAFAAGAATVRTVGAAQKIPARVDAIELWQDARDDSTTARLARLTAVEEQSGAVIGRLDRMEGMLYELWCAEFPTDCRGVPR